MKLPQLEPLRKRNYSGTEEHRNMQQLYRWFLHKFNLHNLQLMPKRNGRSTVDDFVLSEGE